MSGKACRTLKAVAVIIAGLLPAGIASAQGGADSLESQLAAKYKVAKIGQDSSGISVTDPGTVLVIKKGGILSVTPSNMVVIPSYVKDGQVHSANGNAMAGVSKLLKWKNVSDPTGSTTAETKFLTIGEKVYVSKIEVNRKDSKVSMAIIECDSCNSVQDASQRKAQVVFQFPKDYLAGADGGQVSDVISQVLEIQPEEAAQQEQTGKKRSRVSNKRNSPKHPRSLRPRFSSARPSTRSRACWASPQRSSIWASSKSTFTRI